MSAAVAETSPRRIDVHHHFVPPAYTEAMARHGLTEVAGAKLPDYSPAKSLAVMDDHGIATALVSISAPGVSFGSVAEARDLARACNDYALAMRQAHPGRFGTFAVLPMPDTEASCREAERALDHDGAEGVVLLGSTNGFFLGDPRFAELMHELNRRRAVVFVHPNIHETSNHLGLDTPQFLVEFLCDTTRAAVNLVLTGTVERYPDIRFILAHAGGFLPYIAWRLTLANMLPATAVHAPQGMLHYLRRFYYDTALSPSPYALAALQQLVPPSQILFGSDFPFAPAPVTAMQTRALETSALLDAARRQAIDRQNALALFPGLAGAGESVPPLAPLPGASLGARLRRVAHRPVLALAERLRNR